MIVFCSLQLPNSVDGAVLPKKRGRPKGSKNKVKTSDGGEIAPSQPQVLID